MTLKQYCEVVRTLGYIEGVVDASPDETCALVSEACDRISELTFECVVIPPKIDDILRDE